MRITLILVLVLGCTQFVLGQKASGFKTSISLDGKTLADGDIVDVYSFNELSIDLDPKIDSVYDELELQFIIVPFNSNLISFNERSSTMRSIDIDHILSLGPISPNDISHVVLNVLYKELAQSTVAIYTRSIETAADHFQEFKAHTSAGNAENASWFIEQAIKLDPKNDQYMLAQAQFYWELGKLETAHAIFQKINAKQPNYTALKFIGYYQFTQNNFDLAIENYQKAIEFAVNNQEISAAHESMGTTELVRYSEYRSSQQHC